MKQKMKNKSTKKAEIQNKSDNKGLQHIINKNTTPLTCIILKVALLSLIIGSLIIFSDFKGYFNPELSNSHTVRKWNSFYKLASKNQDVDIMLFGNSHLYTGINPKNLSITLGTTAFVFAAPGTNIADSYFGMKEAIKVHKPKIVVIETYGINNFNPYKLKNADLSDQIKSFSARKDFATKLKSTPFLFNVDNYLYAWSTTIRNHDYIFTNPKQLEKNKKLIDKPNRKKQDNKLYLGRYVRFTSGIEKDILEKYNTKGAPVNGDDYQYSKYADYYVEKITKLCQKENIELIFLTLPMYEKHIENYDSWYKELSELLDTYSVNRLDLQKMPNYKGFDLYAFENTYNQNQHMTYNGSLLATYKLADFIRDSFNIELPKKQSDTKWLKQFYGEEGYFENYNPVKNDKNNEIICSNKKLRNITLKHCLLLDLNNKNSHKIIAKVDKALLKNVNNQELKLRLAIKIKRGEKIEITTVDLMYDMLHTPEQNVLFTAFLKPIEVLEIVDGALIKV